MEEFKIGKMSKKEKTFDMQVSKTMSAVFA
jgi:hypothetical protein